jgi:hypothetical protein
VNCTFHVRLFVSPAASSICCTAVVPLSFDSAPHSSETVKVPFHGLVL